MQFKISLSGHPSSFTHITSKYALQLIQSTHAHPASTIRHALSTNTPIKIFTAQFLLSGPRPDSFALSFIKPSLSSAPVSSF